MDKRSKLATSGIVIGIVAGVVAIVASVGDWFEADSAPADLRIVSANVIDGVNDGGQSVDVKVRNAGGEVAFVKSVEFTILHHDVVMMSGGVPSSETYDVRFPVGLVVVAGQVIEAQLSQQVEAGKVDRFTINVGTKGGGAAGLHNYKTTMKLKYNEGETATAPVPLSFRLNFSR